MAWYKEPTTRRIIQEVADDFNITPDDVSGVLISFFDQLLNLTKGVKVKMFTIIGFGKLIAKGHIPKRVNTTAAKRLKVDALIKEQVKEETVEQ